MERNISWLFIAAFIIVVPLFFLALSTPPLPRAYDYEQFQEKDHIVIKFSHVVAENTPKGQAALLFARLAKERTGGRVEVQVYPNSSLYMDGEEVQALQNGNIQLIAPATSKMAEYFPFLLLWDLPFLFDNYEEVHRFIDSPAGQKMLKKIRGDNLFALAMWDNGFKQMIGNRAFKNLEDFENTRIRVMPFSDVLERQFELLGAEPVPLRFSEVFEAKKTKAIDGSENTPSNIFSQRFHLEHNYLTITNHGYLGYIVLTNESFWTELPEDIRQILEEVMEEVTTWQREQAIKFNERDLTRLINDPLVRVSQLTEEEKNIWLEALKPLYLEFLPQIGEEYLNKALEMGRTPGKLKE